MAQYDGSIRINTQINTKQAQVNLATLENRMVKTADKIASLRSKMDSLKDAKIPTTEYAALEKEFNRLDKSIGNLVDKQIKFLETGGKKNSTAYKRMEYDLAELSQAQDQVISKQKKLEESGKAFTLGSGTEEYKKLGNDLKYAENEMELLKKKHDLVEEKAKSTGNQYKKLGKVGKSSFSAISKGAESAKNGLKKIGSFAAASFSRLSKSADKSGGSFSKFSSRLKGILSSLLIFNWVTKAFNAMVSGMKEGFSNLYNDNKKFKNSVNGLRASVLTLKNSFASAFAPIATVAIPYLQSLVNAISSVMDKVAQFTAAITGQKTYLKAVKQTTAAIEEQGKKASKANKKQLSGLDKLNNLSKEDKDDGGAGAGSGAGGEMFKEVKVGDKFEDLAEKFKKMWEKADFAELGTFIGQKLKDGLDSIPWEDVQKTAEKVGKSFATLINGFVKVPGLADTIGKTIAQAINTGLKGLKSFAENLDWGAVGTFIANGLKSVLNNIDWKTAISAASAFGKGIATLLNNALTADVFKSIGTTIGKGITTAFTFVNEFLKTFDWKSFGSGIAKGINEAIKNIDWGLVGETFGNALNAFFDTLGSFAEDFDWTGFGKSIGDAVSNAIKTFDWAGAGESLSKFVNGLLKSLKSFIENTDWKGLGKGITKSISSFFGNIDWGTIGGGIASFATGIYKFLTGLIKGVDWKGIPGAILKAISDFFAGADYKSLFCSIGELIATAIAAGIDLIKGIGKVVGDIGKKVADYFYKKFKAAGFDKNKGFLENGKAIIQGLFNGILDALKNIGNWIKSNVFDPFIKGFKSVFGIHSPSTVMSEQGKYIISGLLQGLKDNISSVLEWLKNIPTWFKEKFEQAYKFAKSAFSGIGKWFGNRWTDIKNVFTSGSGISGWFKSKFDNAYKKVTDAFSGVGSFFSGVWGNIKSAFGNIAEWFRSKFSKAWEAVKKVFSAGGKVFTGIKDGILSGLKAIINALISGINKVIKIPFDGINAALKKIKNISILGKKPFDFIPEIGVPQIPKLATGAVIPPNKEFLAVLGDQKHGTNIEAPLSTIEQAVDNALRRNGSSGGVKEITIKVPVEVDGRVLFELMKKFDLEQYNRTGKPSFQM